MTGIAARSIFDHLGSGLGGQARSVHDHIIQQNTQTNRTQVADRARYSLFPGLSGLRYLNNNLLPQLLVAFYM
jgi:hypothetical protein